VAGRHEHRIEVIKQGSLAREWIALEDLTNEYYVAVKKSSDIWAKKILKINFELKLKKGQGTNQYQVNPEFPKHMTPELARLIGYLIGEGHVRDGNILFSNTDLDIYTDYIDCLTKTFGFSKEYLERKQSKIRIKGKTSKGKRYAIQHIAAIHSVKLDAFFTYLGISGKSSREKEIPWCILQSSKEHIIEFLKALFDGEASVDKNSKCISISSASQKLIKQVQLILLNLGLVGLVKNSKPKWLDKEFCYSNKYSNLCLYGDDILLYLASIGFNSTRKQERLENRVEGKSNLYNCLPPLFNWREKNKKLQEVLKRVVLKSGKRIHFKSEYFTEDVYSTLSAEISQFRTQQERDYSNNKLEEIYALTRYTRMNNIVWSKVSQLKFEEPANVYDGNMPLTHTIITDGIVSHNSDVRLRTTARSIPWSGAKGMLEEESSIDGKGVDVYRYIHLRAIKNKLGAPNLEGWARIWVSDRKGRGRGFDPVYDTYEYAKMTGQVCGSRNKLKFTVPKIGLLPTMSWLEFKTLVVGNKEQRQAVMNKLKFKTTAFNLRDAYKKQMLSGDGMTMFFEAKANGSKEVSAAD
jgi:intein/homing endonuclease